MPTSNAITITRACRAGLACLGGLALVILLASLAEAVYGPRTTIGANYQQWSSTRSDDGINATDCTKAGCRILFQPIPQQKPLIVQHVSCLVSVSNGEIRYGILKTRTGQTVLNGKDTYLVPVHTTGLTWVVNSPVMHLLKSGERPVVLLQNTEVSGWGAECSISGKFQ